ncbi:LITAF domain-containing protein [Fusarium keratoplasticum]|uniref:LITAF domain-containing protein n=1 Tax=Fusarium keratoplasticum TaxID=1328300 RepID=A0ACC0QN31_9HYPO|nr:LITAF domain-containing protein [Fusarium keratoplasticum]KAI8660131.1 LITAF domain-containing protein [Fusarium keratoplasticum]
MDPERTLSPQPPPTYSEATMSALTSDGFAVSPMSERYNPLAQVTVSPLGTPIPPSADTFTAKPGVEHERPIENESSRGINDDCLPEVVSNAVVRVEPPVLETPDDRIEYVSSLEVMSITPRSVTPRTVTPLHMLGDQPESIDCPFCHRRTETRVSKKPSNATHLQAVLLLFTTVCGVAAPYVAGWSFDIEQFCQNCSNRVAYKAQGKELHLCKAPDSWKEPSKFPDAE